MPVYPMTTVERLRQVIADTVQIDAQALRAAIGRLVVATSAEHPSAPADARSVRDAAAGVTVLLADRIPAGQEAHVLAMEIERHFGREVAQDVLGDRVGEMPGDDLTIYEVTAAGFDAGSDATDDLVFWVAATSADSVKAAILDTGATFCGDLSGGSIADVDFTLPAQAMQLSSALLEKASAHRNQNRYIADSQGRGAVQEGSSRYQVFALDAGNDQWGVRDTATQLCWSSDGWRPSDSGGASVLTHEQSLQKLNELLNVSNETSADVQLGNDQDQHSSFSPGM